MANKPKFEVEDHVFYPSAGIGEIESIEDVFIGDTCDSCYVIRIFDSGMIVKVPQSNVGTSGIRPVLPTSKVKELYNILGSNCAKRVTGGNWAERCREIERRINNSSCLELAEVVRDLTCWKLDSGLSFEESMLLETASNYLRQELAVVKNISPDAAHAEIVSHITKSANEPATA